MTPPHPWLLLALAALASCAPPQGDSNVDSNWAIDQHMVYCANTRAGGFVAGNPQVLSGVPLIGQVAGAAGRALQEEETCKLVRTLTASDIAALKSAQTMAVKDNHAVIAGPFTITPHPIGADCVPLITLHRPSGQVLRQETLCRNRRGSYAPLG
jgi:hypothetical protein